MLTSTVIESRHRGLPGVAHGGYVAGLIAAALGGASAQVRLRRPVALDRPVDLECDGDGAALRDGGALLAEGVRAALSLDVPLPVTLAQAEAAAKRFPRSSGRRSTVRSCGR